MAVATTAFTPAAELFGLTNIPESLYRDRANIPRQELEFNILNGTVDAEAGGDSQFITISCVLPVGFVYAWVGCNLGVTGSTVGDDFNKVAQAIFRDGVADANTKYRLWVPSELAVSTPNNTFQILSYVWRDLPNRILIPANDTGLLQVTLNNPVIDGSAATVQFSARFLVFDIVQAHHYLVSTPQLIR